MARVAAGCDGRYLETGGREAADLALGCARLGVALGLEMARADEGCDGRVLETGGRETVDLALGCARLGVAWGPRTEGATDARGFEDFTPAVCGRVRLLDSVFPFLGFFCGPDNWLIVDREVGECFV